MKRFEPKTAIMEQVEGFDQRFSSDEPETPKTRFVSLLAQTEWKNGGYLILTFKMAADDWMSISRRRGHSQLCTVVAIQIFTMQSMPAMPPTSGNMNRGPPQAFQSMPPQVGGPQGTAPPMTNFGSMGNVPRTAIPGTGMPGGVPMSGPPMSAASMQGGYQPGPMNSMPNMGSMPAMPGGCGGCGSVAYGAPGPAQGPPLAMQGQFMPNVSRPQMTSVANPPVVAGNIQYGPSYKMQYQKRSTTDKSAVKYTGFLPLEGVYEEDTCRIG